MGTPVHFEHEQAVDVGWKGDECQSLYLGQGPGGVQDFLPRHRGRERAAGCKEAAAHDPGMVVQVGTRMCSQTRSKTSLAISCLTQRWCVLLCDLVCCSVNLSPATLLIAPGFNI